MTPQQPRPASCTTQLRILPRLVHDRLCSLALALSPTGASHDSLPRSGWLIRAPHGSPIKPQVRLVPGSIDHQSTNLQQNRTAHFFAGWGASATPPVNSTSLQTRPYQGHSHPLQLQRDEPPESGSCTRLTITP